MQKNAFLFQDLPHTAYAAACALERQVDAVDRRTFLTQHTLRHVRRGVYVKSSAVRHLRCGNRFEHLSKLASLQIQLPFRQK